ncbi:MAG: PEP-CTERM sorting domain-containing protein [Candidatus Eisenbacteria bacterium]|nr:PEP-CTERM sorting domain-containing protein [Candidatus Eisenbacteria bacterium]
MTSCTRRLSVAGLCLALAAFAVQPSGATILDLTTLGASGFIGSAYFKQVEHQSTGSGVINPFVRLQHSDWEQGFNTDYRPLSGDLAHVNSSASFTHSIKFDDFGVVDREGTPSIRFLLDINQTGNSPMLSLDKLKIYAADAPDIHSNSSLASLGTLVYDMGSDNKIYLDYSLESGSGAGDMFAYLPQSLVQPYAGKYLYLYSKFGATGGAYATNDGFEEWASIDAANGTPAPVPEPRTLILLGGGMVGLVALRRRHS